MRRVSANPYSDWSNLHIWRKINLKQLNVQNHNPKGIARVTLEDFIHSSYILIEVKYFRAKMHSINFLDCSDDDFMKVSYD